MHKTNKKYFIFALILLITSVMNFAPNAYAKENKVVDLKAISCRELLRMEGDERETTLVFFHGFFAGKNNATTVEVSTIKDKTDQVIDYCINNPNDSLMKAFGQ